MNKHSTTIYDQLIAMWDIQDSLLQSYRNIFLTSQSIIFAIAVFIASGSTPYFAFLLLSIGIFMIYRLWIPICQRRGYDVWFFHLQLLYCEEGKMVRVMDTKRPGYDINIDKIDTIDPNDINIFTSFKKWQNMSIGEREKFLNEDAHGKELLERGVRAKMERDLPYSFVVLWVILALFIIITLLQNMSGCV